MTPIYNVHLINIKAPITMTTAQQRKILIRIQNVEKDIDALKRTRQEIAEKGYSSASISSQGGSKSYTRLDIDKITKAIMTLQRELAQLNTLLKTGSSDTFGIKQVLHVYG